LFDRAISVFGVDRRKIDVRAPGTMFRYEAAPAPGQQLVVANLARIALVQALRAHGNAVTPGQFRRRARPQAETPDAA
jgi:hypothetical protein